MKSRKGLVNTIWLVRDGKFMMHYEASSGATFGMYPESTYIIEDIDVGALLQSIGAKNLSSLSHIIPRKFNIDNPVLTLKALCDTNNLSYTYRVCD